MPYVTAARILHFWILFQKRIKKAYRQSEKDWRREMVFAVRFLACTGARVSELIQIKREHIAWIYGFVSTKAGKVRRIGFPDYLCSEASGWMDSQNMGSGFLFRNRKGGLSPCWSQLKPVPDTVWWPWRKRYIHTPSATDRLKISGPLQWCSHAGIWWDESSFLKPRGSIWQNLPRNSVRIIDSIVTW